MVLKQVKQITWVSLMLGLLLTVGCDIDPCGGTPEAFMRKADSFFEQVEEADFPVDSPKWEVYDEEVERLVEVCLEQHKHELSAEQRKHFRQGVGEYYIKRFGKAGAKDLLRMLDKGIGDQLKKAERWLEENL